MSARRKVKYREEYTEQFPSIKRGRTEYEAFCKICGSYISISNGGRRDINDHVQSKKHKTAVGSSSSKQLTSFFKTHTDADWIPSGTTGPQVSNLLAPSLHGSYVCRFVNIASTPLCTTVMANAAARLTSPTMRRFYNRRTRMKNV
ncbi:uncharacterized protein LOC126252535 [Schistocerca nitens]|uniref:uncharacterized protein LOC126252535 n=1 Tax=Schistocerca nitens TaxID=7011 RepID=UPI0021197B64|nr:uncharacterized protein LOC126252535 [Schistocerca nitens]